MMVLSLVLLATTVNAFGLFQMRHPVCPTQEAVFAWVYDNITYEAEPETNLYDDWQTPEETLILGTGDCEDFTILAMYLLDLIGIDSEMLLVYTDPDDEDEDGDLGPHAMMLIDGRAYEPQLGRWAKYDFEIIRKMTFMEAMLIAYSY